MRARLKGAGARMGLTMTEEQADKFIAYHAMLEKANREMNLTGVSLAREAADRNYLDSLTLLPHIGDALTLIDVGAGAGLPGIPIAIMRPDMRVTLLDAQQKRVAFLTSVIESLGLNAMAAHARCEDAARLETHRDAYDIATARAVADASVLSEWLLPFVKPGGRALLMKGPAAREETERAAPAISAVMGELISIRPAPIPDRDWNHQIVEIRKIAPTPPKYPRRAGMAEKRPIGLYS